MREPVTQSVITHALWSAAAFVQCLVGSAVERREASGRSDTRPLDILTCVPVVGEGERSVAELAVAQWGHRGQTGVIFSLRAHHVDRGLRRATALWEVLRPLGLAHQAFF